MRIKQVFTVGGTFNKPSSFTVAINRNIKILMDSDRNCEIVDVKFNVLDDPKYNNYGLTYLAFIIAEVDIKPEEMYIGYTPPELSKKEKKKKKRNK